MKNLQTEFKGFQKSFDTLAYRHGYYRVFEDFLDLFINGFCFDYKIDLKQIQSVYNKEERLLFGKLIKETIFIQDKNIKSEKDWFDFFGSFYELSSLSKQKGFAQYFTPKPICDFMSQILSPQEKESFSDPCSGSGRFSLAANSVNLGMFHFLVDLDYTCAKMSALNLMIHGIGGIVICDNGLLPGNNFKGAFIVNRFLNYTGIPQIEFVQNINLAYNYVRRKTKSDIQNEPKKEIPKEVKKKNDFEDIKIILNENNQYSLF